MLLSEAASSAQQKQLPQNPISVSSGFCCARMACTHFLLLLLLSAQAVFGGQIVKYLPGFPGELPFKLETGYISVNDSELFYYFIESEGNPQEDPILLWLTGGPGCTSFNGLIYQVGPLEFVIQNYTGGLPKLRYYPYGWTKSASILFLDSPIGAGFSYSRTAEGWATSDSKASEQAYQALRKWFEENPQYLLLQLYVAGDSYGGMFVPLITKKIIDGNIAGLQPLLNIKGYNLGSPYADKIINLDSRVVFAHRLAILSDEIYERAKRSCNGTYQNVDPTNTACLLALGDVKKCTSRLFLDHILEPKCVYISPEHGEGEEEEPRERQRSLQEEEDPSDFLLSPPLIDNLWCRFLNYALSDNWANDEGVQDALHVRKGAIPFWQRCSKGIAYTKDIESVVNVHRYLTNFSIQAIINTGDRDMIIPFTGTVKWIKSLNLRIVNDWRPWFVDGQVAGYTVKYSKHGFRLTYATIKGGGHTAPEYYRKEGYEMFDRWVHYYEL